MWYNLSFDTWSLNSTNLDRKFIARICGKIKVFCLGDHMNKFSSECFLWLNIYHPVKWKAIIKAIKMLKLAHTFTYSFHRIENRLNNSRYDPCYMDDFKWKVNLRSGTIWIWCSGWPTVCCNIKLFDLSIFRLPISHSNN